MSDVCDQDAIHDDHCCKVCGCKYGDDDCPVVAGRVPGLSPEDCEGCQFDKANQSEAEAEYATLLEMLGHGWRLDAIQLDGDRYQFRFFRWSITARTWRDGVGPTIRAALEAARATETPPAEPGTSN